MPQYDVAIVGAGVVGCAIARQLSRYDLRIALIDAAEDVAMGASRANSAIVHAGYDCPAGSSRRASTCAATSCSHPGAVIWTCRFSASAHWWSALARRTKTRFGRFTSAASKNGVPGMKLISGDEARAMEPALSKDATMALYAATGGITCPYQLTIACAENRARQRRKMADELPRDRHAPRGKRDRHHGRGRRDHDALCGQRRRRVLRRGKPYAGRRFVQQRMPRQGEYMLFDRKNTCVRTVIFQTPSKLGKGVLVSPTVDGNMFIGPTAVDMDDKRDTSVTAEGIAQLTKMSKKSVPDINLRAVITSFAGVRAQPSTGDFVIGISKAEPRLIQAAGICSPGLTSSPAIAEEIDRLLHVAGLVMHEKADYNPIRRAIPEFRKLDNAGTRRPHREGSALRTHHLPLRDHQRG